MALRRLSILLSISIALGFLANAGLHAQGKAAQAGSIRSAASSQRILLGESFTFSLQVSFPPGSPPAPWPALPDSLAHFEQLEPVKIDSAMQEGLLTVTHTYKLTSFDSGHWVLPAVAARWGKKGIQSDTIGIDVMMVPLQGNAYRDIHEIVEVEEKPFNWKLWAAVGLTVLLVSLGAWYYLKNRRKPRPQKQAYDSKLSPYDQAMQTLRTIRDAQYLEKGDARSHYTGMTDAFKIFLLRKFNLPVMAETTGEILLRMQDGRLDRDALSQLATALRLADAAKFAKYPSGPDEGMKSLDDMESILKILNQQNPQA